METAITVINVINWIFYFAFTIRVAWLINDLERTIREDEDFRENLIKNL